MDPTEGRRRIMVAAINYDPVQTRAEAEERWGKVWTTDELQKEFEVHGFFAPFIHVTRKSDGAEGSLKFQHQPRWYFGWEVA